MTRKNKTFSYFPPPPTKFNASMPSTTAPMSPVYTPRLFTTNGTNSGVHETKSWRSTISRESTGSIVSASALQDELALLDDPEDIDIDRSDSHDLRTAPLLTRDAFLASLEQGHAYETQYGVLGKVKAICSNHVKDIPDDPRLYVNTNAPFSAVVCGVQGSGKSHTVATLLESMLVPNVPAIGSLKKPLCGLVLHFGEGGTASRPSESAWIGVSGNADVTSPPVRVYVSKSSLKTMKAVYAPLGSNVTVEPLYFDEDELDARAFLTMMAVGSSESAPLYMQIILSILRDLGENFTYGLFMRELETKKQSFNPAQLSGLEQRLSLLKSFIRENSSRNPRTSRFAAGQLTIIDLSDIFIDPASACGLFEILTRLFVRADVGTGKILVVDEAHKYLSSTRGTSGLTNALLTLTREQRHLAMRVIISTQEPTVIPPVLLDLCTVAIMHRFSSLAWWDHLSRHVSADLSVEDAFDQVVKLKTGEAIVLAPSGLGMLTLGEKETEYAENGHGVPSKKLGQFGRRYLLIKTRRRVTADGGASVLVV